MDSAGLGMLLAIRTVAEQAERHLQLNCVPQRIEELLRLTGLADVFDVIP